MAFDINSVIVVGRLTRDVEFSRTSNNTPLCKFSIANNNGSKEDTVSFFGVVVWNKMAEICNQYIKKGSQVVINGRIQQNRYQNKDGQHVSSVEIVANSVQFVGGKSEGNNSNGNGDPNFTNTDKQEEPHFSDNQRFD